MVCKLIFLNKKSIKTTMTTRI
uniref:Uncharacterized protein n=1 Tax=Arundo donax TaxID=35708 RepID=A0A0A8Z837_ARUDO